MGNPNTDPTVLASSDDLTGKAVGRFQITALLGKGGMGEVYLAEDSLLKRPVALKRVSASLRSDPQYRELLIREAERASSLNDEHVAHVHDVLEHGGEIFIVMEYVDGQSLRQRTGAPMPPDEFLPIALQCAEALVAAYQSGIVHRDIKPENIMVTRKGRVKICDFGLARQGRWTNNTALLDRGVTAGFRGTPAYMAPEALLNQNPDYRADMFSLGIVFYELLSGKHPFREEDNHIATADRILHGQPAALSEVTPALPAGLCRIITKMLQKNPAERYRDPKNLLDELKGIQHSRPVAHNAAAGKYVVLFLILAALSAVVLVSLRRPAIGTIKSQHLNLVVLPFRAVGGTTKTGPYSDGLTETVTARLSQLSGTPDLVVTPASEVRIRNVNDAAQAKKQFGADLILAGTLYQSDSESRFTYSLYEAGTLRQFTADTVTTTNSTPFALEDKVINGVTRALGITKTEAGDRNRTSIPEAYDSYVEGRGYLQDASDSGRLQIAMQAFQHARELDPSYAIAYASLGEAYWAKYQGTKEAVWVGLARESCEKADELNPRSAEAKNCLGTVDLGSGQFERSISIFQSALEIDPANDSAYLGLASGYERVGDYEAAEKTYQQAIRLKPNFYLGYVRLGQFYIRRGRYADAADQFQKEITLIPNSEQPYIRIGGAYIYLNRYDDAITVLRKSIELRPTASAYSNLGSTYLRLRRFDEAVPVFEAATKLFPRNFIFAGNLARAYYWAAGQRPQSTGAYERAIMLASDELLINPRSSDAHIMLARYYAMLGKRPDALQHLTSALTLRPSEPEYLSIAAVVHTVLGDSTSAIASLRKAISLGWSIGEIRNEIEFDNIRTNSAFQQLIQQ